MFEAKCETLALCPVSNENEYERRTLVRLTHSLFSGVIASISSSAGIYRPRPGFRKNKPKILVSVTENERFGLVLAKTVSIIWAMDTLGAPCGFQILKC
jgi:hypothetical protein